MLLVVAVALIVPSLPSRAAHRPLDEPTQSFVSPGTVDWIPLIATVSSESGVPWQVLRALMTVESGGDSAKYADSFSGVGLMQVTPGIRELTSLNLPKSLWDPYTNVRVAADYLAQLRQRWGSWDLAIAAWYDDRHPEVSIFSSGYSWDSDFYRYLEQFRSTLSALGYQDSDEWLSSRALLHALTAIGMPYVGGGHSIEHGGFDCSGLTYWAYGYVGKTLHRGADEQWVSTARIEERELRPGDLVFFSGTWGWGVSHVGLYVGNGMMLHSPNYGKVVQLDSFAEGYWAAHLTGFGRVE